MPAVLSKALSGSVFHMLPPQIESLILDTMDFPALMRFRVLSRSAFARVDGLLRAEFRNILAEKVPEPVYLEAALRRLDAYVGTYSALAFLLRASFHKRFGVEIFLSRNAFHAMRRHMRDVQQAECIVDKEISELPGALHWSVWRTSQGRISLFQSSSSEALLPIAHVPSSALIVYANPDRFGAAWPKLTFSYRAMPGQLFDVPPHSSRILRDLGFSTRLYLWMWKDEGPAQVCAAPVFMCPAQRRYLHDSGSFVGTWNPPSTPGLTTRICFRLDTRPCRGQCRRPHPHLTGTALVFEY